MRSYGGAADSGFPTMNPAAIQELVDLVSSAVLSRLDSAEGADAMS